MDNYDSVYDWVLTLILFSFSFQLYLLKIVENLLIFFKITFKLGCGYRPFDINISRRLGN
jgi:hypothetical protein